MEEEEIEVNERKKKEVKEIKVKRKIMEKVDAQKSQGGERGTKKWRKRKKL